MGYCQINKLSLIPTPLSIMKKIIISDSDHLDHIADQIESLILNDEEWLENIVKHVKKVLRVYEDRIEE